MYKSIIWNDPEWLVDDKEGMIMMPIHWPWFSLLQVENTPINTKMWSAIPDPAPVIRYAEIC